MIENLKKVELHLHLDGSVRPETIKELSNSNEDLKDKMSVSPDCSDLKEYLEKFDLPIKYMQTKENLIRISKELIEDLKKDNVIYAEIRFAPQKHRKLGLSLEEVVVAVLTGLFNKEIKTKLILCMMRGDNTKNNLEVINVARKYNLPLDLAGNEKDYPNELYKELFDLINMYGLDFTIHSGEARGKESIISAINMGTKRIGHGINIENDYDLIKLIRDKDILLEICPTSNLNTKVVNNIKDHPIYNIYKNHIKISINTDNRTVSNISLNDEYKLLIDNFNFTIDDFIKINIDSINHSFLSENEKKELIEEYISE